LGTTKGPTSDWSGPSWILFVGSLRPTRRDST
jgi:hypothetical protein